MDRRPLALITGASGGIGAGFARRLAPTQDLFLVARSRDRLEQVQASVASAAGEVELLSADLSTTAGVESTIGHARASGRPVDLLVNNAGSGKHGPFPTRPCGGIVGGSP